jgi:hypothetical protein
MDGTYHFFSERTESTDSRAREDVYSSLDTCPIKILYWWAVCARFSS